MDIRRGNRINIVADAVPADAVDDRHHKRENALVIFSNLFDQTIGVHHKVMFNAGKNGVIFKRVLASEVVSS